MFVLNDNSCSWINDLNLRQNFKTISKNISCNFLIIGAGITGLSAARKLASLFPKERIIIVDSQRAGEGASSRNSGYLVDTTLNDGFTTNKKLSRYKIKTDIYDLGIKSVKRFIKNYQVDCDWNECGKFFASSKVTDIKILEKFSDSLSKLGFNNNLFLSNDLKKSLGTEFYKVGLHTTGGILLHPGKLVRAMIDVLPENVELYENSTLLNWKKNKDYIICDFIDSRIKAKKIIFCTNGFFKSIGIKKNYNFPLTLTASMTRSLTDVEFKSIGEPKEWGVLPVRPMGATVRMTKDRRILIRNTADLHSPFKMNKIELKKRSIIQKIGIKKRFPQLPDDMIKSTWSGVVSRSGNGSQIFEKVDENIYAAGCYNGSGIGVGTLFGEQIAIMASNQSSDEIEVINNITKPNRLPPNPILNLGVQARLFYERIRARSEV